MPASEKNRDDLALIREAAEGAGRIALSYFRQDPQVWMKTGNSPVTEADLAADKYLKDMLLTARPDYGWISEETLDDRAATPRRRFFVVDPIDGTRAFIEGTDVWCVSVAVIEDGRPVAGVLECPARGQTITALPGQGAEQNGAAIHVSTSGVPFKVAGPGPFLKKLPDHFQQSMIAAPYIASLAYRIAMVARGDIAGTFVRPNSHDWDLAAADLILAEAGGHVLTANGKPLTYGLRNNETGDYRHGALVAASGLLMDNMLDVVAETAFG
ncbi:3'(2'),5'-bisphosphate nucleotidase CysQ [Phyllobacterium sp. 22229]|uniref:3'(2'),5'-bisphosphate nucleotidase CysQ n=2 Tax=Pseudomonadota TaxID=1224 RepID=A0A2S9JC11_9HYPH|nr:3'(2'),5'-bisphosphate nucleotidase CysQ [Phyllobacterium myrsinacearum]PRD50351.1 3'(2'),5'-bisphosphate nucleotidase CysQ [Phyllobacterium myrsinacearum]PWV95134.1 myo-inositol-1(or 4)-monophosphatase [Phyllobacterium myrsinacearum]RZS88221.1 myo-inositol-1(or 4)-monophosphatase [Phyllobacterium myrsinacearum]RZV06754.1 myo-inositol-1(or 4)-monophosphatase [Phyllobacterium myrsinacearum]